MLYDRHGLQGIFLLDCLKNFFTGYLDEEDDNAVVLNHREIVLRYNILHATHKMSCYACLCM